MKCKGITLKDKPCSRNAETKSEYCYQHKKQGKTKKIEIPGLKDNEITQKARVKLAKGPSTTDCKGHIYIYYLLSDEREAESYWKIGRTTQTVEKRLSQWSSNGRLHLKKTYEVKYNKLAESVIHKLLDKERVYRYAYKTGKNLDATRFHTVWKNNREPVLDTQNRQSEVLAGELKLEGSKKQIEWFICDWKHVKRKVEAIVKYVNKLK